MPQRRVCNHPFSQGVGFLQGSCAFTEFLDLLDHLLREGFLRTSEPKIRFFYRCVYLPKEPASIYLCFFEEELKNSQTLSQYRQQIISDQLIELADLKTELESWKTSDEQKAKQIAELLTIIAELEKRLKELSESCKNIVTPLQEALTIAEKEVRQQKIEKWVFTFIVGVTAGYVGYKIGRASF